MNLANKISITRILLIPFFIAAIIYDKSILALGLFVIAVISDGLDGYIARTRSQKTVLGSFIDPIADKLLLLAAFICLSMAKNYGLPPWVVLIVISRDVIIMLGSTIIYVMKGHLEIIPSKFGKITTFLQMSTIMSVLLHFRYSYIIWYLAVFFTVLSGIGYIRRGSRLLSENYTHK